MRIQSILDHATCFFDFMNAYRSPYPYHTLDRL